jgi:aryl-alcohol dehydrogenase-like predicted oxidoreductase
VGHVVVAGASEPYADGGAEEELGRAIRDLPRRHLVLASKAFFPASERANDAGLSRKHLFESVETSLRRLGTDYLDLHQCHREDPNTPLEETVRAYEDLIRQGKLLYWGVSEWSAKSLEAACALADRTGAYRPIASQPQYSILRRDIERDLLATGRREGVSQIVFSPLAQGVLSGKYADHARPGDSRAADRDRSWWMARFMDPEVLSRVDELAQLASELELSLAQLALAWCLREPNVACALVGVTQIVELETNVAASGVELPRPVLDRIDAICPLGTD